MYRCGSSTNSHHDMVGPCSCGCNGLYNHHHHQTSAFSVVFSVPTTHKQFDESDVYAVAPVDCTLSLGTPSTRLGGQKPAHGDRRSKNCVTNFCWDLLKPKSNHHSAAAAVASPPQMSVRGGDSDHARRCTNCDTTSTPLWRNGPRGPKSLCNACGIRFKKEERKATAAAATSATATGGAADVMMNNSWVQQQYTPHHPPPSQKLPWFAGDDGCNHDAAAIPFLSWRLNVSDRPGLVHDFTR